MNATPAITAFSQNTDRHDHTSSSAPEASSPSAALAPATAAQVLTARACWARGNVLVIVDRVAGMTNAAAMPSTVRRTIRVPGLGGEGGGKGNSADPARRAARAPRRAGGGGAPGGGGEARTTPPPSAPPRPAAQGPAAAEAVAEG